VRARRGAPVSAPCTWEEIERGDVEPATFTIRNVIDRVKKIGDLWSDLPQHGQALARPIELLAQMSR
jgi:bifunctional non-homologous end joining protein LigD